MYRSIALACFVLTLIPESAWACSGCSAPRLFCVPGFGLTAAYAGLVFPILAGFVERPFVTLAGVRRHALGHSLRANILSALLTGVAGLFVWDFPSGYGDALVTGWIVGSIALSAAIEYLLLRQPWRRSPFKADFGWLLLGNVVSAGAIALLPILREAIGPGNTWQVRMIAAREPIGLTTIVACLAIFVAVFLLVPRRAPDTDPRRGFEVILTPPAQAEASKVDRPVAG